MSARLFEVLKELQQTAQAAERMNRKDERREILDQLEIVATFNEHERAALAYVKRIIRERGE